MTSCDVLIVGAGAGGIVAGARLAHSGLSVLIVEREAQVGGRASTETINGFRVNTGAAFWEPGGIVEATCRLVGAPFHVRRPRRAIVIRVADRDLSIDRLFGSPVQRVALRAAARRLSDRHAAEDLSVAGWVRRATRNRLVHTTVRNLCASAFAADSEDLPVRVFLAYFAHGTGFGDVALCPRGTIGVLEDLATAIEQHGGTVWLDSDVDALQVDGDRVTGAVVRRPGGVERVECRFVICNAGPEAAIGLCGPEYFPETYRSMVAALRPCPMIAANIATRQPLTRKPFGGILFTDTRRLCSIVNFTATCPEMAPPGWHLAVAWSIPLPGGEPIDEDAEVKLLLADLRAQFPAFRTPEARVLSTRVLQGSSPAQRAMSGFDLPRSTPLRNLWNIGDANKEEATAGIEACARSAVLTVDEILAAARKVPTA